MTDQTIFLVTDGNLTPLSQTPYAEEKILQQALEDFPDVIAGPATAGNGGRLLLVSREMRVPDSTGVAALSLDHLFVDGDGVPVLVEVKRATDTRIRREVVAQMLDYAANGAKYWPAEHLRALVEGDSDADDLVTAAFGEDIDPDRYWRSVEQNLRSGHIRLIFLADSLPPELVRIIEFLNEQMRDTEVLGVEVPQYSGPDGQIAYVPRVIGRTAAAVEVKRGTTSTRWTAETMLALAEERHSSGQATLLRTLFTHVASHGGTLSWGTGASPGVTGWYPIDGVPTPVWNATLSTEPTKAVFYFVLHEYSSRHPSRVENYALAVSAIPGLLPLVDESRASDWRKNGWVRLPLDEAAKNAALAEQIVATLGTAIAAN